MQWIDQNRWEQNSVPHKHNYFVIISVKNGSGTHLVDLAKYELKENTIYCLTPGQIHLLKADPGIDGCVISFRSEFLCLTEGNFDPEKKGTFQVLLYLRQKEPKIPPSYLLTARSSMGGCTFRALTAIYSPLRLTGIY